MNSGMAVTRARVLGGRYVLVEVLGAGGMATVWRARDEVLGREVAVKVLSPQYAADPGFLARFGREARHVAGLSHPRLVTVFDSGVDGGTAFIVMELVAGRTLRQVLDEAGTLPAGEAVAIAAAVCEGLEAAHAAGLVHRDIKPANIALADGEVRVLDFGIARDGGTGGGTRTQEVLGTAAYLAPEQASGGQAGPQADLYALGCVLYEMLTGAPPFSGESAVGLAYRHVHDEPGPPSARRPGLPARLDWITGRLLAKDPAARPPGAAAARAGLLAALDRDVTAVLPASAGATASARRGRRRASRAEMVLGGALAAALAALAVVLVTGGAGRGAPAAAPTTPARLAPTARPSAHQAAKPAAHPHGSATPAATRHASTLPPAAAAAAAFVGDLEAGAADGQVTQQAGQDLFNHLQPLLFGPPGQNAQQIQQQYAQLVQAYDQHQAQGQVTGSVATALRQALNALGAALGTG
jgi:hypothetical protein